MENKLQILYDFAKGKIDLSYEQLLDHINLLKKQNINPLNLDINEENLAIIAVKNNNLKALVELTNVYGNKILLENQVNIKSQNQNIKKVFKSVNRLNMGNSLLSIACQNSDAIIIRHLLNLGANPNSLNQLGEKPIHIAAKFGNLHAIKLLQKKSNIDSSEFSPSPLMVACNNNQLKIVDYLIKNGANINLQLPHYNNYTALHLAVSQANVEICKLLLDNKANYNLKDNNQISPYKLALQNNSHQILNEVRYQKIIEAMFERRKKDSKIIQASTKLSDSVSEFTKLIILYTNKIKPSSKSKLTPN